MKNVCCLSLNRNQRWWATAYSCIYKSKINERVIYLFIYFCGVLLVSLVRNTLVLWVKPEFETQNRLGKRLRSILCAGYFIFLSFSDTISFTTRHELQKSSKGYKRSVFVARLLLDLVYVARLWLIISHIHVTYWAGGSYRKNCTRGLEYGLRPKADSRPQNSATVLFPCGPTKTCE